MTGKNKDGKGRERAAPGKKRAYGRGNRRNWHTRKVYDERTETWR